MESKGWVRLLGVGVLSSMTWMGCSDDDGSSPGGEAGDGAGGSEAGAGTGGGGPGTGGGGNEAGTGGTVIPVGGASSEAGASSSMGGGGAGSSGAAGSATGGTSGGEGGTAGEGGEGGEGGITVTCGADEYRRPYENRCRACTNWIYESAAGTGREIGSNNTYDPVTKELSVEVGEGLPLPVSWSLQNVSVVDAEFEPIACAGEVVYSVRGDKLRADLSALVACGGVTAITYGFDLDFGCAGELLSGAAIDVPLTTDTPLITTSNDADLGPFKTLVPEKPFPPFIGETKGPACESNEYREAGDPECRACGDWSYSAFDLSCRVFGTHHTYDPASGEVVIEPGPEMPLPLSWTLTDVNLYHEDFTVVIPPCTAQVHTSVRDGLLIADVSDFKACVAGLPPGAGLDFGNSIITNYGCAGSGCASQWFGVKFDGSTSVYSECFSDGSWPPRHYD
ncbi:MAG: hypothetical protein EOO73_10005 [Myxococcales bacterium]|nr:MAG: hypothetical protein EOO73_10005 [Myxococcales bacterium]